MITEVFDNVLLTVNREEGVSIEGTKRSGTGIYDSAKKSFVFSPRPSRVKSASKNDTVYGGDHINIRLQKAGGYRATIMIPANFNLEELRPVLVAEIQDGLTKIKEGA